MVDINIFHGGFFIRVIEVIERKPPWKDDSARISFAWPESFNKTFAEVLRSSEHLQQSAWECWQHKLLRFQWWNIG